MMEYNSPAVKPHYIQTFTLIQNQKIREVDFELLAVFRLEPLGDSHSTFCQAKRVYPDALTSWLWSQYCKITSGTFSDSRP